ncbi:MAG: helix-turn-helix transcriptional regulator [Variibacter sp.]|nr:helix-turn-helix transcriptional regulator [Variibacter sp.]
MAYRQTEKVRQRLQARHDALLAAARALAAERGMDAVQVAPVAERAGLAAGTVYRYFAAKSDLVAALVANVAQAELAAIRTAAAQAPGRLSGLAAAVVTFAARASRQRRLFWALTMEPVDPEIDAPRREFRQALTAEFAERIAIARDAGHLGDVDPAVVAPALVGALLEGLVGPLAAATAAQPSAGREAVQALTLFALRAVGIADARARGLVVQAVMPSETAPAAAPRAELQDAPP